MKKVCIVLSITCSTFSVMGQTPCGNQKVISPIVSKPSSDSIVTVTCTTLTVGWQGKSGQAYIAAVSFKNPSTGKTDTTLATSITCNSAQFCKATIPVTANTKVNWSVQAVQVINGSTFYSYVLRGKRDLLIPKCLQAITKATSEAEVNEVVGNTNILTIHPNPATDEITVQWSSKYKGTAVIAIYSAGGNLVQRLNIQKNQAMYANRISISQLTSGLYFIGVNAPGSTPPAVKFLKQ